MPLIDIKDTGKFITPALLQPEKYNGATFTGCAGFYTPLEIAETLSQCTGNIVAFDEVKGSKELVYFGQKGNEDLRWTLEQMSEMEMERLTSWGEFVKANEPWFEVARN